MAELTLAQIGDCAREAQIAFCLDKYPSYDVALVRKVEAALSTNAGEAAPVNGVVPYHLQPCKCERCSAAAVHGQSASTEVPAGWLELQDDPRVNEIVSGLYRRFKDWSQRGFCAEDVTWCEVKADVIRLIAATPPAAIPAAPSEAKMPSRMEVDSWRRSLLTWREASAAELIENTAGLKQCLSNAARLLLDHPALAQPAPGQQEAAMDDAACDRVISAVLLKLDSFKWSATTADTRDAVRAALQPTQGAKGGA